MLEFSRQIFEKHSNIEFHENPSIEGRVVPYGRTDMMKLTVDFRNFANPQKTHSSYWHTVSMILQVLAIVWFLWEIQCITLRALTHTRARAHTHARARTPKHIWLLAHHLTITRPTTTISGWHPCLNLVPKPEYRTVGLFVIFFSLSW
jgi:hypothetical protein